MDKYQKPVVRIKPSEGVALVLMDSTEILLEFSVALQLGQLLVQELGGLEDASGKSAMLRRPPGFIKLG